MLTQLPACTEYESIAAATTIERKKDELGSNFSKEVGGEFFVI